MHSRCLVKENRVAAQRPKLSDPAHEVSDCNLDAMAVRCSAWLGAVVN